jgi:CHAD domain-containing protein
MKARKVKGVDATGNAADQVQRIVAVRLDELCSFMPTAHDPAEVTALHDMRIAAKRLRYVLELFSSAFGPYAAEAAKRTKKLQDVLGEVHDCDETLPRIEALIARQREAGGGVRGLELLAEHERARRDHEFGRFLEQWAKLEQSGFRARLEYAIGERPETITSRSHDGNGAGPPEGLPSEVQA